MTGQSTGSSTSTDTAVPEEKVTTLTDVMQPAVVVDQAALTYTVRSDAREAHKPTLRQRLRGIRGTRTTHVEALKALTLVVDHGESVGVIGTNGSGKSTLMNMITGRLQPTAGSVHATSTPILLGVNAALVKSVSGNDNITLGCLAMGMSPAEIEAKRPAIIELCGLEDKLDLPLKAYSSGMASRLQFAIATSVDPEILIIDEALNTGDAQFRSRTRGRIDELREQAGCVFLVSHSLSTIKKMCSRVIWIEQGELLMDGEPAKVTADYSAYTDLLAAKKHGEAADFKLERQRTLVRPRVHWIR